MCASKNSLHWNISKYLAKKKRINWIKKNGGNTIARETKNRDDTNYLTCVCRPGLCVSVWNKQSDGD